MGVQADESGNAPGPLGQSREDGPVQAEEAQSDEDRRECHGYEDARTGGLEQPGQRGGHPDEGEGFR